MEHRRIDLLDGCRSLMLILMSIYHFLYDLAMFGVMTWKELYSFPSSFFQIVSSTGFILLAGVSSRLSRNNLKRGLIVLGASLLITGGSFVVDAPIRFGILHFMGLAMILYHFLGPVIQKVPWCLMVACSAVLYVLTDRWTETLTEIPFLFPIGFTTASFTSADYYPLLPHFFLFLVGTVLGGALLARRAEVAAVRLPPAATWLGRHSLFLYLIHQPILYGICTLIWG